MIGRTEFQNVSGTRCATDFVELPSILLEHFLGHEDALAMVARHHSTGRPLQLPVLNQHLRPMRQFAALELHDELILSLLDQRLHLAAPDQAPLYSTSVFERTQKEASLLGQVAGLDWQARFSHLVSYPASYYSYPLDRALAAAVWSDLFADRPLSRDGGRHLKEHVLRYGGSREPMKLLADAASSPAASAIPQLLSVLHE